MERGRSLYAGEGSLPEHMEANGMSFQDDDTPPPPRPAPRKTPRKNPLTFCVTIFSICKMGRKTDWAFFEIVKNGGFTFHFPQNGKVGGGVKERRQEGVVLGQLSC